MIPKIIHQIWLSSRHAIPEQCVKYAESVRAVNPSWQYRLWTAPGSVDSFLPFKASPVENYDKIVSFYDLKNTPPTFISDVLRILLLYEYGGVYLDMDVEAIKPLDGTIDALFFAGYHGDVVEGAVFGSVPKGKTITRLKSVLADNRKMALTVNIIEKYGVMMFSRTVKADTRGVKLYGTAVFHAPRNPDSIVVHHFCNSWVKHKRTIRL